MKIEKYFAQNSTTFTRKKHKQTHHITFTIHAQTFFFYTLSNQKYSHMYFKQLQS